MSANAVQAKSYSNADPDFQDAEGEAITSTTRSVAESAAPGDPVGAPVTAVDIGSNGRQEVLTYSVDDDADPVTPFTKFTIDAATGQIKVGAGTTLDFDAGTKTYSVVVTATDPEDATDTITVTIAVTNVEEPPRITDGDVTISYAESTEDTPNTADVGTYTATDDEDVNDKPAPKALTWSLSGADADDFCITAAGVLQFVNPPDYEAPTDTGGNNRYEVTVVVTDSEGNTDSEAVTVTVTNVKEAGKVTLSSRQPQNGINLTATLTDPDGRISGVKWAWATEPSTTGNCPVATDPSWVVITRTNAKSVTYRPVGSDIEGCLRATATYTDGEGLRSDRGCCIGK